MEFVYNFFAQFPDWLATFFLSMLPVTELRGSIPFAVGFFKMPVLWAFVISVFGNIIPAIIIVRFMRSVADWLSRRSAIIDKALRWWFTGAVAKFEKNYAKYGVWGLLVFVAIPLPGTGAWTGAVAAFLFNIPREKAILAIFGGVVVSGVIMALVSSGAAALF